MTRPIIRDWKGELFKRQLTAVLDWLEGEVAGWSRDAFGRQRVSETGQRLDVEFLYDKQPNFFDEITTNGTVTFNTTGRDLTLSISDAAAGTFATMRSHPVPYTPGNSQLIEMTGVLNLAGIAGGIAQVFLRSSVTGSVTEEVTDQASWSGAASDVDWSDSHIFAIDFQSLKVGTIRFGLVQNGEFTLVHQINNDNTRSSGFWQLASLPVYYRIYNDATYTYMEIGYGDEANAVGFRYRIAANASATMKAICSTVKSEGGTSLAELQGLSRSADNGETAVTISTTLIPILSIRPKATFQSVPNMAICLPKAFTISPTNPVRLEIIRDATLTGAAWADVDATGSVMEFDTTATAVTGGTIVYSGYFASAGRNSAASLQGILGKSVLWNRQGAQSGTLTVAAVRTENNDADCFASLQWDEIR